MFALVLSLSIFFSNTKTNQLSLQGLLQTPTHTQRGCVPGMWEGSEIKEDADVHITVGCLVAVCAYEYET